MFEDNFILPHLIEYKCFNLENVVLPFLLFHEEVQLA